MQEERTDIAHCSRAQVRACANMADPLTLASFRDALFWPSSRSPFSGHSAALMANFLPTALDLVREAALEQGLPPGTLPAAAAQGFSSLITAAAGGCDDAELCAVAMSLAAFPPQSLAPAATSAFVRASCHSASVAAHGHASATTSAAAEARACKFL